MYVSSDLYLNTHAYICIHAHIHTYMYLYTRIYTHIHISVYTHIHTHTYICKHIPEPSGALKVRPHERLCRSWQFKSEAIHAFAGGLQTMSWLLPYMRGVPLNTSSPGHWHVTHVQKVRYTLAYSRSFHVTHINESPLLFRALLLSVLATICARARRAF